MSALQERLRPDAVVAIEGTLNPAAAAELRNGLATVPADEHVILDFSHVRTVEDIALATLADGLVADHRVNVRFRGLSQHQERVLRYLGMDPSAFGLTPSGLEFPLTS